MYTRFKSQKSGIKVGLNTIANTTRQRVVVSPSATNLTNPISSLNGNNVSNKLVNDDLSVNPITTTASIVVVTEADKSLNESTGSVDLNNKNIIPFDL